METRREGQRKVLRELKFLVELIGIEPTSS
jgi:hypothetical protein